MSPNHPQQRDIYSISRLVREARGVLEGSFPLLWVEGEISNLAQPSSGHIYFSLKDEIAQVRCAMFRMKRMHLRFRPENGQQVLIRARVSLYEARGEFQLIVEHMEPSGEGALRLAFEQLKARLDAEGLFARETKRPLPSLPQQIGLITSPSGAAVRDLLTVLRRRFPVIPVVVYPVPVQGTEAPAKIVQMIQLANRRQECDLLILSRGGGSLEDLQAFNDESVARAIFASEIPLMTGIGHEIDFTIADFVADLRAPTPSAAAEHATPDRNDWLKQTNNLRFRMTGTIRQRLREGANSIRNLHGRLSRQHPKQRLMQGIQRLDELFQRLQQTESHHLMALRNRLNLLQSSLLRYSPQQRIVHLTHQLQNLTQRLQRHNREALLLHRNHLHQLVRDLHNLSPLNTLSRGYAIVSRSEDGQILRSATETKSGESIIAQLASGHLICEVVETHPDTRGVSKRQSDNNGKQS